MLMPTGQARYFNSSLTTYLYSKCKWNLLRYETWIISLGVENR